MRKQKDRHPGRNPPSSNRLQISMKQQLRKENIDYGVFYILQLIFYRLWLLQSELVWQFGELINLLEGYGNDNPGAKSQGIKQLMAGGGVVLIGTQLVPLLANLF